MDQPITLGVGYKEDISDVLVAFVPLVRLGLFQEASDWFEKHLRRHVHFLPVFVEYAEMLLMEGSYRTLADTLENVHLASLLEYRTADPVDVEHFLGLLKAWTKVHLDGMTEQELQKAFMFWDYLKLLCSANPLHKFNVIQVRAIDLYVRVVMRALGSEQLDMEVEEKYTNPPFGPLGLPKWSGFGNWYTYLRMADLHWKAQKIQSLILPITDLEKAMQAFIRHDLFLTVADESKIEEMNESLLISELETSNNICEYLLESQPRLISLAEAYLDASKLLGQVLSRKSNLAAIIKAGPLLRVNRLEVELVNQTLLRVNRLEEEMDSQRRSNHCPDLQ